MTRDDGNGGAKKEPDEFFEFVTDSVKGIFNLGRDAAGASFSVAGSLFAAVASLLIPGLGQLLQGRFGAAVAFLLFALALWPFMLGWIIHALAALEALLWAPRRTPPS